MLSQKNLEATFNHFDKDGSGQISGDEVTDVLCPGNNDEREMWNAILKEVDADGDGLIDFDEFASMMRKLI